MLYNYKPETIHLTISESDRIVGVRTPSCIGRGVNMVMCQVSHRLEVQRQTNDEALKSLSNIYYLVKIVTFLNIDREEEDLVSEEFCVTLS